MAEEISPLENHNWWMKQLRKDAKANRPEALRLADQLIAYLGGNTAAQAAAELRRLHAVNAELLEALRLIERLTREADGIAINVRDMLGGIARAAIARAEEKV
jgi:hypothetical protein